VDREIFGAIPHLSFAWRFTMPAQTPAAYGMYPDDVALRQVVQTLNQSGFEKENICVMVSPQHPIAAVLREANILGAGRDASAVTTALITWLMKLGAVMIPTVGFFIRSQPFLHALLMRKDSRALCDHSKVLVGLGFSENDAERFENELREMGVLIYVSCPEGAKTTWAADVLRRMGAREAATVEAAQTVAA
jgi:Heat induced stress protein YflT